MCYLQDLSDNGISDSDRDLPDPVFNVSLSPPSKKRQRRLLSSKTVSIK